LKIGREGKIALGLITFCLINYFYLIPTQVVQQGSSPVYPLIVNTFILVSSIGYFYQSTLRRKRVSEGEEFEEKKVSSTEKGGKSIKPALRVIAQTAFIIIWVTVLEYVGFLLSSMVFLAASIILYGSRNYFKIITASILFPLVIYLLFKVVLKTALPEGILENLLGSVFFGQ